MFKSREKQLSRKIKRKIKKERKKKQHIYIYTWGGECFWNREGRERTNIITQRHRQNKNKIIYIHIAKL